MKVRPSLYGKIWISSDSREKIRLKITSIRVFDVLLINLVYSRMAYRIQAKSQALGPTAITVGSTTTSVLVASVEAPTDDWVVRSICPITSEIDSLWVHPQAKWEEFLVVSRLANARFVASAVRNLNNYVVTRFTPVFSQHSLTPRRQHF